MKKKSEFNYWYKDNYTHCFDIVGYDIKQIVEDVESNCSFYDICSLYLKLPAENHYNLISNKFQPMDYYNGECIYYMPKIYYPIILEIEKIINSNSKEFIELIKKYE